MLKTRIGNRKGTFWLHGDKASYLMFIQRSTNICCVLSRRFCSRQNFIFFSFWGLWRIELKYKIWPVKKRLFTLKLCLIKCPCWKPEWKGDSYCKCQISCCGSFTHGEVPQQGFFPIIPFHFKHQESWCVLQNVGYPWSWKRHNEMDERDAPGSKWRNQRFHESVPSLVGQYFLSIIGSPFIYNF